MSDRKRVSFVTMLAILIAIEIVIMTTPLGALPAMGPIIMTIAHVPVIVAAVILGLRGSVIMGLVYGSLSFLIWTFAPRSPVAFLFTPFYSVGGIGGNFWSLVVCFVPRIALGFLSYFFIRIAFKRLNNKFVSSFIGAFLANFIASVMLMLFVYVFFSYEYSTFLGIGYDALKGVILLTIVTSSVPESIFGGLVAFFVDKAFKSKM